MSEMNSIVGRLLAGTHTPVMPIMTHPGIELTGRRVIDAVTDGKRHCDAVLALHGRFPYSAASTTIMDLSAEAEAFGAEVVFTDDEVPTVTGRLLQSAADVDALQIPSLDAARIPQYLEAGRKAAAALDCPLFGGCIGPFSLACRLYDMTELMMSMYIEPDMVHRLLDKCTEFIMAYVRAMKSAGQAGVVMAEPAAGLLSDSDCLAFSSEYVRRIVEEVQDDSFLVVLHNCGNSGQCTGAMVSSGAAALHFGNAIDMAGVLEQVPSNIAVMGNVDPVGVMKMGTPETVEEHVRRLLDTAAGHGNFILSTGCDVPPASPFENIEAFFRAAGYNL